MAEEYTELEAIGVSHKPVPPARINENTGGRDESGSVTKSVNRVSGPDGKVLGLRQRQWFVVVIVVCVVVICQTGLLAYLMWAMLSTDGLKGSTGEPGTEGKTGPVGPAGPMGPAGTVAEVGGSYVRWGRTSCPVGVQLVYAGVAAGSFYDHTGGGANYICLHRQPEWANYTDGRVPGYNSAILVGAEYQYMAAIFPGKDVHNHDVPCVVCHTPRTTVLMIPGRLSCPGPTWTLEYRGYLTAEQFTHKNNKAFECLDRNPEVIQGGGADTNGALFYTVEGQCGYSLPCPNYVQGREITCVVCSL